MSYNNCRKRFFEKNRFFHRIHYNIRVKMGQYPPLLSTFFRQWTIDPERNRWVGREFVSPQIMEIEIEPSSTTVRRYVFVSSWGPRVSREGNRASKEYVWNFFRRETWNLLLSMKSWIFGFEEKNFSIGIIYGLSFIYR